MLPLHMPSCLKKHIEIPRNQEGGCKAEVPVRIGKAWNRLRQFTGVLCDKKVPKKLKLPTHLQDSDIV